MSKPYRTLKELREELNHPRRLTADEEWHKKKRAEKRKQTKDRLMVAQQPFKDPETEQAKL